MERNSNLTNEEDKFKKRFTKVFLAIIGILLIAYIIVEYFVTDKYNEYYLTLSVCIGLLVTLILFSVIAEVHEKKPLWKKILNIVALIENIL